MKKISLLALVAAFALVGAGCTTTFDVEDQIEESDQVVEDVMDEEGSSEEGEEVEEADEAVEFTLGYDEGTDVVYIGSDSQGTVSKEYSGQQIITGYYAQDMNLSKACLTLDQEELEKIPEAIGEATEHYCLDSADLLTAGEGDVTLRVGKVEVEEVAFGKVWTLEVLEVME